MQTYIGPTYCSVHTYMHTYIHTYILTYTHLFTSPPFNLLPALMMLRPSDIIASNTNLNGYVCEIQPIVVLFPGMNPNCLYYVSENFSLECLQFLELLLCCILE